MIVYGTRLYGYCDEIEGVGHVATQFAHIWFLPLIPLKGFFVFDGDDDRGVEIPMRGKSVLSAWLRSGFIFGGIGSLIAGFAGFGSSALTGAALVVCAIACFVGFALSGRVLGKMNDERRAQLLSDTGLLEAMLQAEARMEAERPKAAWEPPVPTAGYASAQPAQPAVQQGPPAGWPEAQPAAAFNDPNRY